MDGKGIQMKTAINSPSPMGLHPGTTGQDYEKVMGKTLTRISVGKIITGKTRRPGDHRYYGSWRGTADC